MKLRNLLVLIVLAILLLASAVDAQRTARIQRPCPGSTTPAKVEAEPDGDVAIRPCETGLVRIGDYDGVAGGTYLEVDDANMRVTVTGNLLATLGVSNLSLFVDSAGRDFEFQSSLNDGVVNFAAGINRFNFYRTVTAGGTTGNQTINRPVGTVNFAAGTSSITVSNSTVAANSLVFCTIQTNDATATACRVTDKAAGTFNLRLNANATAETSVAFWVTN